MSRGGASEGQEEEEKTVKEKDKSHQSSLLQTVEETRSNRDSTVVTIERWGPVRDGGARGCPIQASELARASREITPSQPLLLPMGPRLWGTLGCLRILEAATGW